MADSLRITRSDLIRHVSRYLGFNGDNLDTQQAEQVNDCIDTGLRQFYVPPVLRGEPVSHVWSFMTPVMSLPMIGGVSDYDLPDDFGGFVQNYLSFAAGDQVLLPINLGPPEQILALRQRNLNGTSVVAQPQMAAVTILPATGEQPQRHTLMIWPSVNGKYTIKGPYYSNPYQLTADKPYPLGGQPHADTLRRSCLAAAELDINDMRGPHYEMFMERLAASVSHDRSMGTKNFGYNSDRSDPPYLDRRRLSTVTYQGKTWGPSA